MGAEQNDAWGTAADARKDPTEVKVMGQYDEPVLARPLNTS